MNANMHGRFFAATKRRPLCLLALALLTLPLRALAAPLPGLVGLIPEAATAELALEGRAVRSGFGTAAPALLPRHPAAETIRAALATEPRTVLVEAIFLYGRPAPTDGAAEFRTLYGLLRAVSSLEGIEYWSESRKTMRTFYAESYRIDGPETRRRLPDEALGPGPLPSEEAIFVFQRDLSFGANVYRYAFRALPGAIALESSNLTRMSYGLVPVLGPDKLRVRLLVIPAAEGILFYVASAADAASVPGLKAKLESSFANRAEALFRWFSRSLSSAAR